MQDRVEKQIELRAPVSRVWRALTDPAEFGRWFGVRLEQPFVPGKPCEGHITTKGYEHLRMRIEVRQMEPERLFSFNWHPYAVDPDVDYSQEAQTLVEFHLQAIPDGTLLRLVESGFSRLPAHRYNDALRMNELGWSQQLENIARHVTLHP
jgi:uncharacterized protein YndB with AHSA1/START domain